MVGPYMKALRANFKDICDKMGIIVHFKGSNAIWNLLVAPKDKDNITQKSGLIYSHKNDRLQYTEE